MVYESNHTQRHFKVTNDGLRRGQTCGLLKAHKDTPKLNEGGTQPFSLDLSICWGKKKKLSNIKFL